MSTALKELVGKKPNPGKQISTFSDSENWIKWTVGRIVKEKEVGGTILSTTVYTKVGLGFRRVVAINNEGELMADSLNVSSTNNESRYVLFDSCRRPIGTLITRFPQQKDYHFKLTTMDGAEYIIDYSDVKNSRPFYDIIGFRHAADIKLLDAKDENKIVRSLRTSADSRRPRRSRRTYWVESAEVEQCEGVLPPAAVLLIYAHIGRF